MQPAVGKLDQILLQRFDAEGVRDAKFARTAGYVFGVYVITAVTPIETRLRAKIIEIDIGKIAQHRLRIRGLHGELMMGAGPVAVSLRVTGLTRLAADERRCDFRWRRRGPAARGKQAQQDGQY